MQKNILLSLFILYSLVIAAQDEFILYPEYKSTKQIVDITNYLPNKFVKDGSINYTTYLQAGLDENKNVIFPDFPIKIDIGGLILNSGQKVFFNRNSLLVLEE